MQGKTNTENTTEITTERYPILSIHQDSGTASANDFDDGSDGWDAYINQEKYMELIRENICYDALIQTDNISDRNMYEEMYLLICDVVRLSGRGGLSAQIMIRPRTASCLPLRPQEH